MEQLDCFRLVEFKWVRAADNANAVSAGATSAAAASASASASASTKF